MMDYGTKLRIMRTVRDMPQTEVEKAAGLPHTTLSHIERGRYLPSPDVEARIREALDWPEPPLDEIAFGILEGEIADLGELALPVADGAVTEAAS